LWKYIPPQAEQTLGLQHLRRDPDPLCPQQSHSIRW